MYKTERNCSPMLKIRAQAGWNLCGLGNCHRSCHSCLSAKLLQSCPTLWDLIDCSPPGSSVHGILQARILEWVAVPSFRGSSWPRDWTHIFCISCTAGRVFTAESPGKPLLCHASENKAPKSWFHFYLFIFMVMTWVGGRNEVISSNHFKTLCLFADESFSRKKGTDKE